MTRVVFIALLVCDHPPPDILAEHGDQAKIFEVFMRKSLESFSDSEWKGDTRNVDFCMDSYNVIDMEFPSNDQIGSYDAIMIPGSPLDAYAKDEWIQRLIAFIAHVARDYPRVKIFGMCFGHQIVSLALGGTCVNNNGKWELGPTKVYLTDIGEKIFRVQKGLIINEGHEDHVPFVPQGFHLLGSTDVTMNQGMVSFYGTKYHFSSASTPTESGIPSIPPSLIPAGIHILTVQSHPELTNAIMSMVVNSILMERGVISKTVKEDFEKWNRAFDSDKVAADSLVVGRACWRALGVGTQREFKL